jgi:hypothetical protein
MNLRTMTARLSRRQWLLAALGVVVVVAVVLAITLSGSDGTSSSKDAAGSTSATGSSGTATGTSAGGAAGTASATATPSGVADPNKPPAALPAVGLDATAAAGTGVTARLTAIDSVQSKAGAPGQVAGPALRVTVRIKNGTNADFSLDGVAVNLSYGKDNTPGSPAEDSSSSPFTGTLPAGDEAEGVYVFSVPKDSRDVVTVEVGYQPGAPLMIFSGPVK